MYFVIFVGEIFILLICQFSNSFQVNTRQTAQTFFIQSVVLLIVMDGKIQLAKSEREILDCYSVMAELRPHLKREEFVQTVHKLSEIAGFQLVYLNDNGVKAVAGFRISEWLANGKYLEIEDLVAKSGERSKGFGGVLFDWLVEYAKENNCRQVRLVSHVNRLDAHRFYLRKGMNLEAHYFSMNLN